MDELTKNYLTGLLTFAAAILTAEARSQQPGDNASLTDKASTRNGFHGCTERHANDIRREQ